MKLNWDKKYLYWGITAFLVISASVTFVFVLFNFSKINSFLSVLAKVSLPISIGFAVAYLLNPLLKIFEIGIFYPLLHKTSKSCEQAKHISHILGVITTTIVFLLMLILLFWLVIPQILQSISQIIKELDTYYTNLSIWINKTFADYPELAVYLDDYLENSGEYITKYWNNTILPDINSYIGKITGGIIGFITVAKDILLGIIIAVYVMAYKNHLIVQAKKITLAFLPVQKANSLFRITRKADKIFGGFISGKILDSIIIGILCFIGMSIFNMPFPMLISVIVGVTNVIPFFGPFFGAIPSCILLLIVDPIQSVYFAIFVLALQQFDGNILGPKILGDSTGLSSFWVIITIILSGGLFGFLGMLLGVPVFALIYVLIKEYIENKLKEKNLPADSKVVKNMEAIDADTMQIRSYDPFPTHHDIKSKSFFTRIKELIKKNKK